MVNATAGSLVARLTACLPVGMARSGLTGISQGNPAPAGLF